MSWADRVSKKEVNSIYTFASYACQELGIPFPSKKDLATSGKLVEELFQLYPAMSWQSLCDLVEWGRKKKKRFATIFQLINSYRWAYSDGYLDEIDSNSSASLEEKIEQALASETDPEWRRRLLTARGPSRKVVYAAWLKGIDL